MKIINDSKILCALCYPNVQYTTKWALYFIHRKKSELYNYKW